MKINILTFICLLLFVTSYGQEKTDSGHYLVEFEKFTPPVKDMIRSFEGFPATPFMANDMDNEERFLSDFQGKVSVLFFWNTKNAEAVSLFYDLNRLQKEIGEKKLAVIGMADDTRAEMDDFLVTNPANFIIIPNTRMLSEAVYAVELGYPRLFVIDSYGLIRCVIPGEYFSQHANSYDLIERTILSYL
jgi:peroxiredoxin